MSIPVDPAAINLGGETSFEVSYSTSGSAFEFRTREGSNPPRLFLASGPVFKPRSTPVAGTLPFDLPDPEEMRSSPKKVFAHYFPPYPIRITNQPADSDYYARNYLNPDGEGGKHSAYGGLLRDRPLPRPPFDGDYEVYDFETDVKEAIEAGLDGFAVDILSLTSQNWTRSKELAAAAARVDPGFSILLQPDMSAMKDRTVAELSNAMAQFASNYNVARGPNGEVLISPFKPENKGSEFWTQFIDKMRVDYGFDVILAPLFLNWRANIETYAPFSHAIGTWGERSPEANDNILGDAAEAQSYGLKWIQPVSVQDTRPNGGSYYEAENLNNLRVTWDVAIEGGADYVILPTWNDYSEGATFAPSANHGWTFLDVSAYYAYQFKFGTPPPIARDALYVTHRIQKHESLPTYPQTKLMKLRSQSSPARDTVEVMSFLTEPGTISVSSGGDITTYEAPAGVFVKTVPLEVGTVAAGLARNGVPVTAVVSPYQVVESNLNQNLDYYGVSSLRTAFVPPFDTEPPSAPGELTASASGADVGLAWGPATDDGAIAGYEVHRGAQSGFELSNKTRVGLSVRTSFTDTPGNGQWFYRVVARDTAGNYGPPSNEVSATASSAPLVETVTAEVDTFVSEASPTVSYGSNPALASRGSPAYQSLLRFEVPEAPKGRVLSEAVLQVRTNGDGGAESADAQTVSLVTGAWSEATTWNSRPSLGEAVGSLDSAPDNDATYDIPLSDVPAGSALNLAITGSGADTLWLRSADATSAEDHPRLVLTYVDAAGDTEPPSVPQGVDASVDGGEVLLSWEPSTDNEAIAGYEVHRAGQSGFTPSAETLVETTDVTSFTDTPGEGDWFYRVVAQDSAGNTSAPSDEVTATVSAPVVETVTAEVDTFVSEAAPTVSYGSNTSLGSRGSPAYQSLLRFEVPEAPKGRVLSEAVLQVRTNGDGGAESADAQTVSLVTGAWSEATTWNSRPSLGEAVGSLDSAPDNDATYDIPLSDVPAGSALNLAITGSGEDTLWLRSADATSAEDHPRLVLTYVDAAGDTEPPSVPQGVDASVDGGEVLLSWEPSTDNEAIAGYEVHRAGQSGFTPSAETLVETTDVTSFTDTPGEGDWFYRVVARDSAGNTSAPSDEVTATVSAPVVETVTAVVDTFVNEQVKGRSYGSDISLGVRGSPAYQSLLRFEVPEAPKGRVLSEAVLQVRTNGDGGAESADTQTVSLVTGAWSEATTWNSRPSLGEAVGSLDSAPDNDATYDIPLSDVPAGSALNLAITGSGADALWLHSADATSAGDRPQSHPGL